MRMAHGVVKCPNDGTEIVARFKSGDRLSEKYEFIEPIGSGGMGIIYKARHLGLSKMVAIKLMHPHLLNSDTVMRFQREARTASDLRHPNLITVQDVGTTEDGQPFMVMDYVDGRSLSELIKEKGRLSVEETLDIFLQICSGLAYAHKQNILHRDLKPSNVMLISDEKAGIQAKILDFGIAKVLEEGDRQVSTLTKTGDVFGSPLYMSPEQGAGGKLDRRCDIYSLGCMLFESLSGTPPFMGKSVIETLMLHAQKKAPSLKEASLGLEFPGEIEKVVETLLKKSPDERYQSVLELRDDLKAIQDEHVKDCSSDDNLSRRELRQLATGGDAISGINAKQPPSDWKNIAIALLSIAVLVLLYKDFGPNIHDITASRETKKENEVVRTIYQGKSDELEDLRTAGRRSLAKLLTKQGDTSEIVLRGCNLVDADLVALKGRKEITKLDLELNDIDGTGLYVAMTLPALSKLNVSDCPLSDEGIRTISRLGQLKNLELKQVTLSDQAMKYLGQMKNMEKLEFDNSNLGDGSLQYLTNMPSLSELSVNAQKKMSDKSLLYLKNVPNLHMVDAGNTKVTGEGFANFDRLPKLDDIVLKNNYLTEKGLQTLAKVKLLQELDIRSAHYKVDWLRHLRSAKHFRKLHISDTADAGQIRQILPNVELETGKAHKHEQ